MPESAERSAADVVSAHVEIFNAARSEAALEPLLATLHPDVDWRPCTAEAVGISYRGHEGVQRHLEEGSEAYASVELRFEELTALDDSRVLVIGTWHGTGRGSGIELNTPMGWIYEVRDGVITSMRCFRDPQEARRAASDGR